MSIRGYFLGGLKWTTAATVGRSVLQLLQIAILTRFLPKEAFGLVAMAIFVVDLSYVFVDMGLSSAILHRRVSTKEEYSSIFWLNIGVALVLYCLLFVFSGKIAAFYNQVELSHIIPLLGFNLAFLAFGRQHRTIMQKGFRFKEIAKVELLSYGLALVVAVALAMNDFGVYSLIYSTLVTGMVSNLLFFFINFRTNPIRFHFSISETRPFLGVGGFTLGSTILDFFSRELDILIIGRILGAESLGAYSLVKQIVLKIYHLVNPVLLGVLSPLLASLQEDKNRLKTTYLEVVKKLTAFNLIVYFFIIILSTELLQLLYGAAYESYFPVLIYLSLGYFVSTISNPVGSLQIATGRTDLGFKWTIFRVITTAPVIYLGALGGIEYISILFALLSIAYLVPLWYVQIRPMIGLAFVEYYNSFKSPLFFLIFGGMLVFLFFSTINLDLLLFPMFLFKGSIGLTFLCTYYFLFEKDLINSLKDSVFVQSGKL
jgi:O-antigen/teichoic acid export membrane protein